MGVIAETAVSSFVAENGGIWHPVGAGADYGIDGRIEVVNQTGQLTGAEFAVQIKGSASLRRTAGGTLVVAGRARTDTVRYWLNRLTPTYIIGYDHSERALYGEWVQRMQEAIELTSKKTKPSISLKVSSKVLDEDAWRVICGEALDIHNTILASLAVGSAEQIFGVLYLRLSEINDVLVEHAAYLALASPSPTLAILGDAISAGEAAARTISERLLTRPRIIEEGPQASLSLMERAVGMVEDFADAAGSLLSTDDVLSRSIHQLSRDLRRIYDDISPQPYGNSPVDAGTFYWVAVDLAKLMPDLIAISLYLRDYNRELRRFLFNPQTSRKAQSHDTTDKVSAYMRYLTEEMFTPTPELLRDWPR